MSKGRKKKRAARTTSGKHSRSTNSNTMLSQQAASHLLAAHRRFARNVCERISQSVPSEVGSNRVLATQGALTLEIGDALAAVIHNARLGLIQTARRELRAIIEATVKVVGLQRRPEMEINLAAQGALAQLKLVRDLTQLRREVGAPDDQVPTVAQIKAVDEESNQRLADLTAMNGGKRPVDPGAWGWAEAANLKALYWGIYPRESSAVHHEPNDLFERRIRTSEAGYRILKTVPGRPPNQIILDSALCALFAIEACEISLLGAVSKLTAELHDKGAKLYRELMDEA